MLKEMHFKIAKMDENSYSISNATKLAKITYLVNDTFDTEGGAGFEKAKMYSLQLEPTSMQALTFMLNTHGFHWLLQRKRRNAIQINCYTS